MLRASLVCFALALLAASIAFAETRLPPEYRDRHAAVEACLGVDVDQPKIEFLKTITCPDGTERCMKDYPFFACNGVVGLCGWTGAAIPWENRIDLPDKNSFAFEHEAVHVILWKMGRSDWNDHAALEFAACGHP